MIDLPILFGLAAATGLASAIALSLAIRSHAQGLAIMTIFSAGSFIGLLARGNGQALAVISAAGVIGCAGAIGTFRFWTGGSPGQRAVVTVSTLSAVTALVVALGYFGIM